MSDAIQNVILSANLDSAQLDSGSEAHRSWPGIASRERDDTNILPETIIANSEYTLQHTGQHRVLGVSSSVEGFARSLVNR